MCEVKMIGGEFNPGSVNFRVKMMTDLFCNEDGR